MTRLPFEESQPPKAPEAPKPAAPARTILTVSELNATIRDILENQLHTVWVEGEISNARVWNTGHMYFTLKDGASQIKAVMFRSAVRYLKSSSAKSLRGWGLCRPRSRAGGSGNCRVSSTASPAN